MAGPGFFKSLDTEIQQQELRRFIRSVAVIEGLLLAVVLAYLVLAPEAVRVKGAVAGAIAVYACVCAVFRLRRIFPRQTRLKLHAEAWAMTAFVTVVLWFTGGDASPLLGLYLLPITLCALTLGQLATLLQVAAAIVLYLLLALVTPDIAAFSTSYMATAFARLLPFLLVAYLTSTLAADIFAARRRIEMLAQTDALTGLLNLRAYQEFHRQAHLEAERDMQPYTVLMIDMDDLKAINDSFGHDAGNSAIVLVANCIRRTVRASDIAARFGGDEFVVLLRGAETQAAAAIAQRLRNLVYSTTLDVRARMIRCSVSIGQASFPDEGRDVRELLTVADRNMYRDKELRTQPEAGLQLNR